MVPNSPDSSALDKIIKNIKVPPGMLTYSILRNKPLEKLGSPLLCNSLNPLRPPSGFLHPSMEQKNSDATTLALLGSTGNTGREVLRSLLAKGQYDLRIYVRSAEKLDALFPGIESNPRVKLFVGSAGDSKVIERCLDGAPLIICTLGSNEYHRTTILQDSAHSMIKALETLKLRSTVWHKPRMIYLSSSSQNKRFAAARPRVVHWLITTAFQMGYADLTGAESMLCAETSLVSILRVQPGVLVEEEGTGYEISTEAVKLATAYEDLGRACVDLALTRNYDALHEVGISSKGGDRAIRYAPTILSRISGGIFVCYVPGASMLGRIWSHVW